MATVLIVDDSPIDRRLAEGLLKKGTDLLFRFAADGEEAFDQIQQTPPDEAVFVIRDEGPGFDLSSLPDPRDPSNLKRLSGRGLLLIHTFMDEVRHNAKGNEITMIKRRDD